MTKVIKRHSFEGARYWFQQYWSARPCLNGVRRLICYLLGIGARKSHDAATRFLLALTLCLEGYLLYDALSAQTQQAVKLFHASGSAVIVKLALGTLSIALLAALFTHQLLIFRNFSREEKVRISSANLTLTTTVEVTESQLAQARQPAARGDAATQNQLPEKSYRGRLVVIAMVEIAIFLGFGVITGEAGYMLTIMKDANPQFEMWLLQRLLGIDPASVPWGHVLEALFLLSGTALCGMVLLWDILTKWTPPMEVHYRELWRRFLILDLFSMLIWCSLFLLVTSNRESLVTFGGVVLVLSGVTYIFVLGGRLVDRVPKLGAEKDPDEAQRILV